MLTAGCIYPQCQRLQRFALRSAPLLWRGPTHSVRQSKGTLMRNFQEGANDAPQAQRVLRQAR